MAHTAHCSPDFKDKVLDITLLSLPYRSVTCMFRTLVNPELISLVQERALGLCRTCNNFTIKIFLIIVHNNRNISHLDVKPVRDHVE